MYDIASRQQLEERAGYEGWLIDQCLMRLRQAKGSCGPITLEVPDTGERLFHLSIHEFVGSHIAEEVIRDMVPLMFCAAFKIIDMLVEWCLDENGVAPKGNFFSFAEKIYRDT